MTTFEHHLRFSLALALEFEEEGRAESRTVLIADQVIGLADWLAAWLTALLTWFNALPFMLANLQALISADLAGWAADLDLMAEAARLLLTGRLVFLEEPIYSIRLL